MGCCNKKNDSKSNSRETNKVETFFNLLQSNVGTGILALPNAVMSAGLIVGSVGLLGIGFFCVYCVHLLLVVYKVVAVKGEKLDYGEVAEQAFLQCANPKIQRKAAWARHFTNVVLVINQIGACIVYHTFCPHMIKKVVDKNLDFSPMPLIMYQMIITAVFATYSSLVRNFKDMAIVSSITTSTMLACVIAMYQYVFRHLQPIENINLATNGYGFFLFLGSAMFSFEVITCVLPIENKMSPEHRPAFLRVMWTVMSLVVVVYTSLGAFGYLCFGAESLVILTNLPSSWLFDTVTILWVVCIIVSYNLQLTVPASILADAAAKKLLLRKNPTLKINKASPDYIEKYNISDLLIRSALVLLTFVATALVPCLEQIIGLTGTLCSSSVTALVPAICLFAISAPRRTDYCSQSHHHHDHQQEEEAVVLQDVNKTADDDANCEKGGADNLLVTVLQPFSFSRRMWYLANGVLLLLFCVCCMSVGTFIICEQIYERMTSGAGCS